LEQESADFRSLALREYFLRHLWGRFLCFAQFDYSRSHSVLLKRGCEIPTYAIGVILQRRILVFVCACGLPSDTAKPRSPAGFCFSGFVLLRKSCGAELKAPLLIEPAPLHFPEYAFALQLLLQDAERLIDIVVANEHLQIVSPSVVS